MKPALVQQMSSILLLTYLDASTISKDDLLSLSLAISLDSQKITSGTAAVIDLFTNIQSPNFSAHHFKTQVINIARCKKLSDRTVKKHKAYCSINRIFVFITRALIAF